MTTYVVRVGADEVEVTVDAVGDTLRVSVDGRARDVDAAAVLPGWYSLVVDHASHDLGTLPRFGTAGGSASEAGGPRRWTIVLDGYTYDVAVARGGRRRAGPGGAAGGARAVEVRAPMPGLVVAVLVSEGASVAAGQSLVTVEAMKMQMELRSPAAGVVHKIHVAPGAEVSGGQVMVTIE